MEGQSWDTSRSHSQNTVPCQHPKADLELLLHLQLHEMLLLISREMFPKGKTQPQGWVRWGVRIPSPEWFSKPEVFWEQLVWGLGSGRG